MSIEARRGVPLAGSYPAAVAMALLALCPFIVLSTAVQMIQRALIADLHTSRYGIELAGTLSNAGYAFGAVLAADLIQRVLKRHLYICAELVFVLGSLVAAFAPDVSAFTAGRLLQGLSTGVLLVVALPPLVTNHGVGRLPLTAAFVNLGLFGMVTAGPLVGGAVAGESAWRALFLGVAGLGAAGMLVGALAFERGDRLDRRIGFDFSAVPVAAAATVLPFFGVAWLSRGSFGSPGFIVPVIVGLAALGVLLVRQYGKRRALMPLKLITHTFPITGVAVAMVAGAAFTALIELAVLYLLKLRHEPPATAGVVLAGQILGVVVAAWLFARVFPTRWLPAFALGGLAVVVGGGILVVLVVPGDALLLLAGAGLLLGFGAGAGVSPGLFMAGLSVPSNRLGPTFALVELLRAEAAFLLAPLLVAVALAAAATVALPVLLALGGVRPHPPDLAAWLDGEESAYTSPPLAAAVRD